MIRKICLVIIAIAVISGCSNQVNEVVSWKPNKPKSDDKITINFRPQRLLAPGQPDSKIFMVYQLIGDRSAETFRIPMKAKKHGWQATIKPEAEKYLLRLKFEDEIDRMEDNKGLGWNIIILDRERNIAKNAHYKMGVIFSQENASAFIPGFDKADSLFKKELALFPGNYKTWYHLWSLALKKSNRSREQLDRVKFQLDSLLTNAESHAELFALAFNTNWKLLNDHQAALKYGELILSKYKDHPVAEEIEYSKIFLKKGESQQEIVNELIEFSKKTTNMEIFFGI